MTAAPAATDDTVGTRTVISGARWSFIAMVVQQGGRLAFSIFLARLIGPESFGVVSQATIYVSLTALFLDQGLGASIIQRRRLGPDDVGTVLWLNSAVAVVLGLVTIGAAPVMSAFFSTPELTAVLRVLAVTVVLKGLSVAPAALLSRHLRFRRLAYVEAIALLGGGAAGIAVGLTTRNHWALVVQLVVMDVLRTGALFVAAGRINLRFSGAALRSMWGFSSRVMAGQTFQYANRNLDNVLVGRYLGAADLALYGLAYRVLLLPLQLVGQVANRVAFPTFARLQHDGDALRLHFVGATRIMALTSFPLLALVVVSAPVAVPVVFGAAWADVVLPMQILAVTGMRHSVQTLGGPLLMSQGRARAVMLTSFAGFVCVAASLVVGLRGGVVGVAIAYSLGDLVVFPVLLRLLHTSLGLRPRQYLMALVPALIGCCGLVAAWIVVSQVPFGNDVLTLVVASITAVGAYVLVVARVAPRDVGRITTLLGARQGSAT